MKAEIAIIAVLFSYVASWVQTWAEPADTQTPKLARMEAQFTETAPYSDETNITKHFGYTVPLPDYAITNETFQLRVPPTLSTNESWGLLVWIGASDEPTTPADWDLELAKHHLLFVSAHRCGNSRHPLDRFRMALDATCNMCRRYKVDRRRIYIGGFSGGARMASMLGVAYSDIFKGTLCCGGVNFYKNVAGTGSQYYPATFTPNPSVLQLGKRNGRFVLLTGERDPNRESIQQLSANGFKREGFRNVFYFEIPGLSHEMPPASALGRAFDYLGEASEPKQFGDGAPH